MKKRQELKKKSNHYFWSSIATNKMKDFQESRNSSSASGLRSKVQERQMQRTTSVTSTGGFRRRPIPSYEHYGKSHFSECWLVSGVLDKDQKTFDEKLPKNDKEYNW